MKNKSFSPLLAPNQEVDLNNIIYPCLVSYKMDGIRCIVKDGKILSRSLKPIPNKQLRKKLEPLRKYTEDNNVILDGEIYSPNLTFQEIVSFVMTENFESQKSIKKFGQIVQIPVHLKFYCFDCISNENFNQPFHERYTKILDVQFHLRPKLIAVDHWSVFKKEQIENLFQNALNDGCEGLILRNPNGRYKFGRGTIKESLIYKVKPFATYDAQIIGIEQATKVDENAEKKINELGRSVTSKKKDDRVLINKASGYIVKYEDKTITIPLGKHTDEQKEEIWKNQEKYIGKWIEYRGMTIGMKDVPRIPKFVRYREDK